MKTNLNLRGGDFAYSAPTVDVMTVQVEQGFAASEPWSEVDITWGEDNQLE